MDISRRPSSRYVRLSLRPCLDSTDEGNVVSEEEETRIGVKGRSEVKTARDGDRRREPETDVTKKISKMIFSLISSFLLFSFIILLFSSSFFIFLLIILLL